MTQVMLLDILPEGGLEHEMLQLTVIGCHDNWDMLHKSNPHWYMRSGSSN